MQQHSTQSFSLGFWEYGINGMLHPLEGVNAYVNLRLSKMKSVSSAFEKTKGSALEIEGQYRLGDGRFQPYALFRYQLRRMRGGQLEYIHLAPPIELDPLVSHTLAIGFGLSLGID